MVNLSSFADDKTLYIEKPKDSTKKVLELINEFSKVAGYKINFKKSVAFLYANNELTMPIKIPMTYFIELEKIFQKFI